MTPCSSTLPLLPLLLLLLPRFTPELAQTRSPLWMLAANVTIYADDSLLIPPVVLTPSPWEELQVPLFMVQLV